MLNTKHVLVTGAPGWLGTRLIRILESGLNDHHCLAQLGTNFEIRCLVRPGEDVKALKKISNRVRVVEGDLRESSSLLPFFEEDDFDKKQKKCRVKCGRLRIAA